MARRLLAEAEASPSLIRRSAGSPGTTKAAAGGPFSPMALLSDPAIDIRRYLEDLVRIAVGSARQAEDVSSEAREATRHARRGMAAVASFAALGVMVGVAGFTASRSANVSLNEVHDQVGALQAMQQQAQDQLADITARTPDPHDLAKGPSQPSAAVAAVGVPPVPAPVRSLPSMGYYAQPWPDARPPPRRVYTWHSTARPPVVPRFVADIERNLRAAFR